jgi:hypothetical protein
MIIPDGELARLRRRGFWLEYASMAWMVAEAGVAITAGVIASSIALTGFGLDSVIELFSAGIVVWQLRGGAEDGETSAVRLVGVTFFALAAYLVAESIHDLVSLARPEQSVAGLAVTAAALLIMPGLAIAKRRTGSGPGQPHPHSRLRRNCLLRFHLRCRPDRPRPQRVAWLVVGRPGRSARHRRPGGQGRRGSLETRRLNTPGTCEMPARSSGGVTMNITASS